MDIQPIGYLFLEALQKKRLKKLRKIRVNFHRFNRSRDDEKLLENIPSQQHDGQMSYAFSWRDTYSTVPADSGVLS